MSTAAVVPAGYVAAQQQKESVIQHLEHDVVAVGGFLKKAGLVFAKDASKGLAFAVKYAVPIETLTALIFPQAVPAETAAFNTAALIQNAVISIEQKYALANVSGQTGQMKAAEVLTLVGPTVTDLLTKAGVKTDTTHIQNIISAVVAVLNVQSLPVS